ncbi:BN860_03048g1_1 [Zygosaccharomyces bailii CLIB 213]|uniref:Protoporphyrinogen oxidase n=1 Tax=Zygosaccharomyces bailii (strain CLIB 213 / ATCC 58445 / CBS 680 / BCRC 21525 / NBRC 1098 / NCYC 1416 / NRRL Y-2227) TaxID=1333698 RepID=A0A8J2X6U5_ZYGB2|nr:BN860_03048g1_1 [Zygosaccharomyces bailii CLIB 213]
MLGPLNNLPANARVGVVGGGISGLTFTYFLGKLRPDVKITLFESQPRTGGWIHSFNTRDKNGDPVMLEQGPRTLRGVSDGTVLMADILRDLKRQSAIQYVRKRSKANRKFLLDPNDNLVQVPNSITTLIKFLLNPLSKGLISGFLGERMRSAAGRPRGDESVHSFISRRFGNEYVSTNLVSAVFHGIYADDVKQLSARKVMGRMVEYEAKYGSILRGAKKSKQANGRQLTPSGLTPLVSLYQDAFEKDKYELARLCKDFGKYSMIGLTGGLETFTKAVSQELIKWPNVEIVTSKKVGKITLGKMSQQVTVSLGGGQISSGFDHLRLTTNPSSWAELFIQESKPLSELSNRATSNTVLLVNYYLPGKDVLLKGQQGFGYLVPQCDENVENLLGVIFDSVIEKNYKAYKPVFSRTSFFRTKKKKDYTKLTIMLGGHHLKYEANAPSKDITIRAAKYALHNHLGISLEDLEAGSWEFVTAKNCLPHFFVGYNEWQNQLESQVLQTYKAKVSLGGMGFSKGPGVPDVVTDAFQDVLKLTEE